MGKRKTSTAAFAVAVLRSRALPGGLLARPTSGDGGDGDRARITAGAEARTSTYPTDSTLVPAHGGVTISGAIIPLALVTSSPASASSPGCCLRRHSPRSNAGESDLAGVVPGRMMGACCCSDRAC